jgi:hypothetical protein
VVRYVPPRDQTFKVYIAQKRISRTLLMRIEPLAARLLVPDADEAPPARGLLLDMMGAD